MGQKVHPIGFRLGVYRDWDARWFARKSYGIQVLEDLKIREYLLKFFESAEIARIEIEKAGENVRVIIHSARPGIVIGKKGQEIDALRKELAKLLNRANVDVSVQEVKSPELDANVGCEKYCSPIKKTSKF